MGENLLIESLKDESAKLYRSYIGLKSKYKAAQIELKDRTQFYEAKINELESDIKLLVSKKCECQNDLNEKSSIKTSAEVTRTLTPPSLKSRTPTPPSLREPTPPLLKSRTTTPASLREPTPPPSRSSSAASSPSIKKMDSIGQPTVVFESVQGRIFMFDSAQKRSNQTDFGPKGDFYKQILFRQI